MTQDRSGDEADGCGCRPSPAPRAGADGHARPRSFRTSGTEREGTVLIPGGQGEVGTDRPVLAADGEGPARTVTLAPFAIDAGAVTNARFAAFLEDTGYVTDAERFGWSFVFHLHVTGSPVPLQRVVGAEWWRRVEGADWRNPEGPGSDISERLDHPVVHVSHNDAVAFAGWSGGRLPEEAEWEHAARGGLKGAAFPWGEAEPTDDGPYPCNIWQGTFPSRNSEADGYSRTAPALSFPPNGYGLHNMCGNVWEWCADPFRIRSLAPAARLRNELAKAERQFVQKGGSFLCHRSYCYRYRIEARIGNSPDTSTSHAGFRLAYDVRA